jgi:serine/threonine protein phosphatase 1
MIYLVSDVHGCYNSFITLLNKINFKENDTMICIGDLIDRGKYSFKLLDLFMNNENYLLIKGNHEHFFDMYMNETLSEVNWWKFGGKHTILQLKKMNIDDKLKYYNYIHKLPLYYIKDNYILFHSSINVDLPIIEKDNVIQIEETIQLQYKLNSYDFLISNDIHYVPRKVFNKELIVGHTPTMRLIENDNKPTIAYTKNCIDIDCGATYKGGQLACLRLDDMKEFYVKINKNDID